MSAPITLIFAFVGFPYKLFSSVFTFLEHPQGLSTNRRYQMDNISHYNMGVYYVYTSFNIILLYFTNYGASIMCHMQWFEIRWGLPSRPGSWPQKVSILFHMLRQAFPTFIIFQLFPSLSFYSNSLTTGSFSFEHILSILKGIGYMLKNFRSKNLIGPRNSIFFSPLNIHFTFALVGYGSHLVRVWSWWWI